MPLTTTGASDPGEKLDETRATLVYTMFHHLGDFVVMSGLLRKFDLLGVRFESLVIHQNSPYCPLVAGSTRDRFFNLSRPGEMLALIRKLRQKRKDGHLVFGLPMAPGSIQAHLFFRLLQKLGALTYVVDFNLVNADLITPPRRRYLFDRHLAQAAEIFQRPDWLADTRLPLGLAAPPPRAPSKLSRVGFFPWSARAHLPEFKWPDENWLELARRLLANPQVEIALLGRDPAFAALENFLRSRLPADLKPRLIALPAAAVADLLATLETLDALITLNTSALHLAHALQIPLVALCGSSLELWQPEGTHIRLVRDTAGALPPSDTARHDPLQPSVARLEVEAVHRAFLDLPRRAP
jgi:ADP-heptose:LPS heptosyltransferase